MLDGTSLLEAGFSDCANEEEVRVNPDGILLLHPAIGGMDMHVFACYICMNCIENACYASKLSYVFCIHSQFSLCYVDGLLYSPPSA